MKEFDLIAKDILANDKFKSLKNEPHHGITRYAHIMHVSKCTYYVSKLCHFDYRSATRGALLHDYFNDVDYRNTRGLKKGSIHPVIALNNARREFVLNEKEENIIVSHMYPMGDIKPACKESWIVTTIDKLVAGYECILFKPKYQLTTSFLFLINLIRW